jgi:serine/threonine protein kinase
MGCVFLCRDQWDEKQVVVKCFWEGRKGSRKEVFGEAMLMRKIAGAYVPEPLDCNYVDAHRQERPYFVSEYIEGALDGENWLAEHGAFDVSTGIAVGRIIAKGLEVAHENGIYHLDLKPANLLFKQTHTGLEVKIIDFGLARVATSLRQEAMSRRSASGMSEFGQTVMGTLLYAPPEQLG